MLQLWGSWSLCPRVPTATQWQLSSAHSSFFVTSASFSYGSQSDPYGGSPYRGKERGKDRYTRRIFDNRRQFSRPAYVVSNPQTDTDRHQKSAKETASDADEDYSLTEEDNHKQDAEERCTESRSTTTRVRRSPRLSNWLFTVIVLLTISHLTPGTSAKYQLCEQHTTGLYFEIPRKINCLIPPFDEAVKAVTGKVWVPNLTPTTTSAYKCSATRRTICTNTGFLGSRGIVRDEETPIALTSQRCKRMQQVASFRELQMVEVKRHLWRTNVSLIVNYEYCCRDVCTSTENALLQEGQVLTYDGRSMSSNLGDVTACNPNSAPAPWTTRVSSTGHPPTFPHRAHLSRPATTTIWSALATISSYKRSNKPLHESRKGPPHNISVCQNTLS